MRVHRAVLAENLRERERESCKDRNFHLMKVLLADLTRCEY
jgi:hypothetical protein